MIMIAIIWVLAMILVCAFNYGAHWQRSPLPSEEIIRTLGQVKVDPRWMREDH